MYIHIHRERERERERERDREREREKERDRQREHEREREREALAHPVDHQEVSQHLHTAMACHVTAVGPTWHIQDRIRTWLSGKGPSEVFALR